MHTRTCPKCSGSGTRSGHPDDPNPCNHCVEGVTAEEGYKLVWFVYSEPGYPVLDNESHEVAEAELEAMGYEDLDWNRHGDAYVGAAIIDEQTHEIMQESTNIDSKWFEWNDDEPCDRDAWRKYLGSRPVMS
jgi:hypothetical protein